jgi:MFS family permease
MELARTFRALSHRNFRLFFVGQGLSLAGTWLQQVATGWLTYRLTGSPWLLGLVAFCGSAGILFFGTFAGVVADHVHRRRALYVTQSLMLAQAVALAFLTWTGRIEVWHLVVLALFLGIVAAFDIPLRQALWVHLVEDRDDLPNAIALNSFLVNVARAVGPALGGLLLAVASEAACFALNALSFLAVIFAIGRMRWAREPAPTARTGSWWASWVEGFRYVSRFPPARTLLILVALLSWTINPYSSLLPVYAKDIFGAGPQALGFLMAAAGVGALASTLYLASREAVRGLGRVIAMAAGTCGLALVAFSHLTAFPLALALMVLVGGGVILAAAGVNTILQTIVEDRMRGRLAGFFSLAFLGVAPLGSLAAGALAGAFGAPAAFAINGVIAAAAGYWFWRSLPALRLVLRPM